jgi:protein involved in polysaccharide export with SLBB domain
LDHDLRDPQVTVSIKEASKREAGRASLLGAVRSPGVYEIKVGTTVAELLADGGGPTPLADLRRVTVTRGNRSVVTVDLAPAGQTGRLEQNAILEPGDIVVVPEGTPPTVQVLGEVVKPGSQEIRSEARLLDVISQAGGLTPRADVRRITLARAGSPETRQLDLQPLFQPGGAPPTELNLTLQPGDMLLVPESVQQIYVLGAVTKPGLYPIKPNDRVLDALVTAGGAGAAARKAALVRYDPQGQPVRKDLDLKKIMARGDAAENELLRPGDVLYVSDNNANRRSATTAILDNVLRFAAILALF